jgi:hypothetical protein
MKYKLLNWLYCKSNKITEWLNEKKQDAFCESITFDDFKKNRSLFRKRKLKRCFCVIRQVWTPTDVVGKTVNKF